MHGRHELDGVRVSAGWASVAVAVLAVMCTLVGALAGILAAAVRTAYQRGSRDRKIDDAIEKLTAIAADHEARLRDASLLQVRGLQHVHRAHDGEHGQDHERGAPDEAGVRRGHELTLPFSRASRRTPAASRAAR